MADALANPSDLASLLRDQNINTDTAEFLCRIGTAVVQAQVGQRLVRIEDDEITLDLDWYDSDKFLYLPERPVAAVSEVKIGDTVVTDYRPQLSKARLWRHCGWRSDLTRYMDEPSTVTVTYTHGYQLGHYKLELARGAVVAMVKSLYRNPGGASEIRIDDYQVAYAAMERELASSPFLLEALRRTYGKRKRSARLLK